MEIFIGEEVIHSKEEQNESPYVSIYQDPSGGTSGSVTRAYKGGTLRLELWSGGIASDV